MVKQPLFRGACTALITPMDEHGIDYERFCKNIDFQYENGTVALVVCGTTGEAATLSQAEHDELVRRAVNHCGGRMKVIVGVGSNNTLLALRNAENAKAAGADGILMVTPYYNKTSQQGLIEHFSTVAERVELPMLLYNVPSRTGISLTAETYRALSAQPNIVGVKEASGDFALISATAALCGEALPLYSGNDADTVPMMALGALGVVSVLGNFLPGVVAKLCALCLAGDFPAAAALSAKYSSLTRALFLEPNPIPVKKAMQLLELDSGTLRRPLVPMGENTLAVLRGALRELGLGA